MLAPGSFEHNKTELYNVNDGTWIETANYPFGDSLTGFTIIYKNNEFLIFGGLRSSTYEIYQTVTAFDITTETWRQVGTMNSPRYDHATIVFDNVALIVGGNGDEMSQPTEKCEISKNNEVSCETQDPILENYWFPFAFPVDVNYCLV